MHDRGMISSETVVKEAGYDFEVEKDRLREERRFREKEGNPSPRGATISAAR